MRRVLCKSLGVEERFVFSIKTDNPGTRPDNAFLLQWQGRYDVDWGDGTIQTNQSSNTEHTYATAGTYTIKLRPVTDVITTVDPGFGSSGDSKKLVEVKNWGTAAWTNLQGAFNICTNMNVTATDIPNLTSVSNMRQMFNGCTSLVFNDSISNWNTSFITDMGTMFRDTPFNQDISNWNVGNVTDMGYMFDESAFNQDISSWDVSNVTNMEKMFADTTAFNQDLSSWEVTLVTGCNNFSDGADSWTLPKPNFTNCTP